MCVCVCVCVCVCLFVCLPVCLFVCLFVCLDSQRKQVENSVLASSESCFMVATITGWHELQSRLLCRSAGGCGCEFEVSATLKWPTYKAN